MYYILPLGVPGLSVDDLRLHLYREAEEISLPFDLVVSEAPALSGSYKIDGLPGSKSGTIRYTLTAEYPDDVGHSFVWGGSTSTPASVVLPIRENGLNTSDLGLVAYKDGVAQALTFTSTELTPDGDYSVSGWPIASTGASWLLLWSRNGATSWYTWTESAAPAVQPQVSGWLAAIIRSGVSIADTITFGGGIQLWVVHEAWIGFEETQGNIYADPVQIRAVVDRSNKQTMRGTTMLFISASLTFTASPEHALTSGGNAVDTSQITPPRAGPIDARDKITLPDGWTAQVVDIPEGVIDPGTGRGFAPVVLLGSEANLG